MSSSPKCFTVSALSFWKDDNKLACMTHMQTCACACMCTRAHTHTAHIPAMGGKAQDCTCELLFVDDCTLCIWGSPGRLVPVCECHSHFLFLSSWFPGGWVFCSLWNRAAEDIAADCYCIAFLILLKGPGLPGRRSDLRLRVDSGPRRSKQ